MGFFQLRVLSFAGVFASTILAVSYKLYHLNNFKILMAFFGVVGLFVVFDLLPLLKGKWKTKEEFKGQPSLFQIFIYTLLPLIGCVPGLLLFGEIIPFFTLIEVFSVVVPLIWMCYLVRELDSIDLWEKFLFWLGVVTLLASGWGVIEYLGLKPSNFLSMGVGRAKSTFGNINYFAGFLVVIVPFFAQLFLSQMFDLKKNFVIPQKFLGLVVFFGVLSLHMTKTRAALFSFYAVMGLSLIYWVFVEHKKELLKLKKNLLFIVPIILGGTGFLVFGLSKFLRMSDLLASFEARYFSWKSALRSIMEAPMFGHGPGTSYQLFFDYRSPNFRLYTDESSFRHAHSEILEFLQEGGLFGLSLNIVFWSILFYILYTVWRRPSEEPGKKRSEQENKKLRYLSLAVGSSFFAYFIHSSFSVAPRMMVVKLPLFTLFGLTFMLSRFSDFKGLPVRVPSWWTKAIFSFSSPRRRFFSFLALVGVSAWGLYQFIPHQYLHYKLLASPTNPKTIKKFEEKIGEKSTPYFLGHLISRQFRLGRIDGLGKSLNQLEDIFSNWRDQKYKMAIYKYKKGKIREATSLALEFQNASDTYYPPNIKFLMDMAKIKGDYELFKKELQYYIKSQVFGSKLNPSGEDEKIVFKKTNQNYILNFQEDGDKLFIFYNDKMLRSLFKFSINLRKQKRSKSYSKNWIDYKKKVTMLVDRSRYFGIQLNKSSLLAPQDVKSNVQKFFNLKNQKEKALQQKKIYFKKEKRRLAIHYGRQKSHPYYIRMKLNLLSREEKKVIEKLEESFDKKIRALEERLESVTNWSKMLRKVSLKKNLLELLYKLPL